MGKKISISDIRKSEKFGELVRFGIVGVIAVIIHNAVYWFLRDEMWPSLAYTIGYFVSWCVNFWLSAHFTFRRKANVKRGVGFALSHISNYLMQMPCFWFFTLIGVPAYIVVVPVTCVCVPINFCLVRYVFKSKHLE